MGVNATTFVPAYVSGEILTAADLTVTNSGIPVFATTVTRDAAFGGAGEKVLAQGQYAYIEATGALQVYTGSAWVTTGGALQYITGASFTTATTVSLPTNTFTSTYRNYKLIFEITALTADADFNMRLRASGTDYSGATYNTTFSGAASTGGTSLATANSQTSWTLGEADSAIPTYQMSMDILSPQVATYTSAQGDYNFVVKASTASVGRSGTFWVNNTGQYDSLTFISSVASSITGNYRVYGYTES
jgi:hypothetical protein